MKSQFICVKQTHVLLHERPSFAGRRAGCGEGGCVFQDVVFETAGYANYTIQRMLHRKLLEQFANGRSATTLRIQENLQ